MKLNVVMFATLWEKKKESRVCFMVYDSSSSTSMEKINLEPIDLCPDCFKKLRQGIKEVNSESQ